MTITVKKEVEETVVVNVPFASKDYCWHYLVTEESVTLVCNGFICRKVKGDHGYENYVKEAIKGTPIAIEESEARINKVIESFSEKVSV